MTLSPYTLLEKHASKDNAAKLGDLPLSACKMVYYSLRKLLHYGRNRRAEMKKRTHYG